VNTEHFINKEVFFKCPALLQGFASVVCQLFSFFFFYTKQRCRRKSHVNIKIDWQSFRANQHSLSLLWLDRMIELWAGFRQTANGVLWDILTLCVRGRGFMGLFIWGKCFSPTSWRKNEEG